jgi:hypothetical protein
VKGAAEATAGPVAARRSGLRVGIAKGGVPVGVILGGLALVGGLAVRWLYLDRLGITLCTFKMTTGIPCMTCGGTRTLALLARGDLAGALAMNPLVAAAFLVLVPWALTDLVLWARGRSLSIELGSSGQRWMLVGGVLALVANWAYLVAMGR